MGDFLDSLLSKLSPEALQHLKEMDLKDCSEKYSEEAQQIFGGLDAIKTSQIKEEVEALARHEQKEIKLYKELQKEVDLHLNYLTELNTTLVPVGEKKDLTLKLESYKRMLQKLSDVHDFDVTSIPKSHSELVKRKQKIAILEKKLEKYAGLPPDINKAKDAIEKLKEEIRTLQLAAEKSLNAEVAQYNI